MDQVIVNQSALDDVLLDRSDNPTRGLMEELPNYPSRLSALELLKIIQDISPEKIESQSPEKLLRQAIGIHSYNIGIKYENIGIHTREEVILRKSSGLFTLFPQTIPSKPMFCTLAYYNNQEKIVYVKKRISFIDESYDPEEPQIFIPQLHNSHFDSPVILTQITPVISEWFNKEDFDLCNFKFLDSETATWIGYSDLIIEIRLAEELAKAKTLPRLLSRKTRGIRENIEGVIDLADVINGKCNGLWLEGNVLQYEPNLFISSLSNNYPTMILPSSSFINALFILNPVGAHQVYQELNEKEKVCIPFPIRNPGGEIEICNIILHKDYRSGKIYHNLQHFPKAGVLLSTQF